MCKVWFIKFAIYGVISQEIRYFLRDHLFKMFVVILESIQVQPK